MNEADFGFQRGRRSFLRRERIKTYVTGVKNQPDEAVIQKALHSSIEGRKGVERIKFSAC